MAVTTIMHIDLDSFFVSVEQVFKPELKGKPVVVGGKPERRGVVATASYEARAFGLYSGMPLVTAARLCPEAVFIEGDFTRYHEYSSKFMAILSDFCPFIEPVGIDEAYLDVTGFESLYGSIHQMSLAIKRRIRDETGLCASIGVASCKVVAKVASDMSKPDGIIELTHEEEHTFLAPLPIEKLPGIGKKTAIILKSMGIHTIGELSRMAPDTIKRRLGTVGKMLHDFANGIDNRKVSSQGDAKSISRETTFPLDMRDSLVLEATLWNLSESVGADIRRQDKQAKCVTLKLRYADFTTITRSHTLQQYIDSDRVIYESGLQLLTQALSVEKQPVRLIGIGVSNLVKQARQLNMLDHSVEMSDRLNRAIDRIRNKYGFAAIRTGKTMLLRDIFTR